MKLKILTAIIIMLSAAVISCGGWKKINEIKIGFPVSSAGFLNNQYGMTVGSHGETHYTLDGGKTWSQSEYVPVACRFNLQIINKDVSLSAGNSGLAVTVNGGKTWEKIHEFSWRLLSFTDQNTGWLASETGKLIKTSDFGKTWEDVSIPQEIRYLTAIDIIDINNGFMIDEKGILYKTADQGKTWIKIITGIKAKDLVYSKEMTVLKFINQNEGAIITRQSGDKESWIIMKTKNGGIKWTISSIKEKSGIINLSDNGKLITILTLSTPEKLLVYENK